MFTQIELRNFKAWRTLGPLPVRPLTVLFGANSSGKSSLLQMLLLLKQTVESTDRNLALHLGDRNSYVELGSLLDVLHGHDQTGVLSWQLRWRLARPLVIRDVGGRGATMSLQELGFRAEVDVSPRGDPGLRSLRYELGESATCGLDRRSGNGPVHEVTCEIPGFELRRRRGRPAIGSAAHKCYGFSDQMRSEYQNADFLADLAREFERQFERVYYLGPLREHPHREYPWGGAEPSDMGSRGEKVVAALLAAKRKGRFLSRGKGKRRLTLELRVADWLRDLGLASGFRTEEVAPGANLYRVWVRQGTGAPEVLLPDVGFGVSQVLPVLALCYSVPEGSTILFEHPEIHLHPAVQAGLADVLLDAVNTRHVQVIVESHSEHLLRRIQRRIAEGDLDNRSVALHFCAATGGQAVAQELQVNLLGEIANWPEGFFGDDVEEAIATEEARLRRAGRGAA